MTHVLLVPGALIFESDMNQVGGPWVPDRLARRLTRARRIVHKVDARWSDGAAHLQWLAHAFRAPGDPPVAAPFAWRSSGGQATDAGVWFCEPVHLRLEPERTVLTPIEAPPLNEEESAELFAEAADSARAYVAELRCAASRWYLLADPMWSLRTSPLQAALGASVEPRLPQGEQASLWRRLLNEVQMRWHASRANRERQARGQQAANGLWLHGGGVWSPLQGSRFSRVDSDDPVVRGWQQASSHDRAGTDSLTIWPHLFEPYWRRDWRAWTAAWVHLEATVESLLQSVRSGPDRRVELLACGRGAVASFMLDRSLATVLPWRRRALRDCLLEATTG
jgi:hypothetical protein